MMTSVVFFFPSQNCRAYQLSSLNETKILFFRKKERESRAWETGRHRMVREHVASLLPSVTTQGKREVTVPSLLQLLVSWCGLEEHNAVKPPAIRLQSDIFTQLLVIGR